MKSDRSPWSETIILLLTLSLSHTVLSIYFTEPTTFNFETKSWPENTTIHSFRALLDADESGNITYSLSSPKNQPINCPLLSIHPQRGQLSFVRSQNHNGSSGGGGGGGKRKCSYKLVADLVEGKLGARKVKRDEINLNSQPMRIERNATTSLPTAPTVQEFCSTLSPDELCFEGVTSLEWFVMENTASSERIFTLGHLCESFIHNYTLTSEVLKINKTDENSTSFSVWVQENLDREQKDVYDFSITCFLASQDNPGLNRSIAGQLKVLDQNDCDVESQNGEKVVEVFISFFNFTNKFEPGNRLNFGSHLALIAIDADTKEVNHMTMTSVNDTMGILDFALSTTSLNKGKNHNLTTVSSTIVYPLIRLSKNLTHAHRWEGDYCVAALLSDNGTDHTPMSYIICLGWEQNRTKVVQKPPPSITYKVNSNEDTGVTYKMDNNNLGVVDYSTTESDCGKGCILAYSAVSLIITVFIFSFLLVVWRRKLYNKKKKKPSQSAAVDASDTELATGYRNLLPDSEYASSGIRSGGFFPNNALFNPDNFFQVESKWQIPREDLKLDHVLGEGEFGRVLKGVMKATGTVTGTVHVAVKMLKVDYADGNKSVRQEFMAEFSLLKQLDHTNVIKLLGACTSTGGPPLLVMEYAEFGSLRSFLRKCRRIEKINHNCNKPQWCELGCNSHYQQPRNLTEVQVSSDYIVTPQEVLGFSWQIAKGMAYLSDMKMVHRDLAARNVLLTKTKVCKISDFGLTRDIYVDDAYKKQSKDRVPVKWLAPECLTDELYTSKSDVWAFGIFLWELTTLGASPYPGIQTELLYSLLDSGYRMPQPVNCSNEVYTIMYKCWAKTPSDRPTFHELVLELSRLLEDGVEYLKLDIPSVSNPGYDLFS